MRSNRCVAPPHYRIFTARNINDQSANIGLAENFPTSSPRILSVLLGGNHGCPAMTRETLRGGILIC
jgi:hypothetical protein